MTSKPPKGGRPKDSAPEDFKASSDASPNVSPELRQLGERDFIRQIIEAQASAADHLEPSIILGLGDDAAVIQPNAAQSGAGDALAVTIDAMIEGTHFRRDMEPSGIGYRLAAANLSDLAAMGAAPWCGFLTFGAPGDLSLDWARSFFAGIHEAASEFGFALLGGDTVRAPQIVTSLTLLGRMGPGPAIPRRSLGRPGDTIWVTGIPGESAAGLRLELSPETGDEISGEEQDHLRGRHFRPTPRLQFGAALARELDRVALIDISDGIYNETELLIEASLGADDNVAKTGPALGAILDWDRFPQSDALQNFAIHNGLKPQHLALFGGEDFELLFATDAPDQKILKLAGDLKVTPIGRLIAAPDIHIVDAAGKRLDIDPETFAHFD